MPDAAVAHARRALSGRPRRGPGEDVERRRDRRRAHGAHAGCHSGGRRHADDRAHRLRRERPGVGARAESADAGISSRSWATRHATRSSRVSRCRRGGTRCASTRPSRAADDSGSVIVDIDVPDLSRAGATASADRARERLRADSRNDPLAALLPIVPTTARDFAQGDRVIALVKLFPGDAEPDRSRRDRRADRRCRRSSRD